MNFQTLRELQPYLTEPEAMASVAAGKRGRLRLVFEQDGEGRSILRELERRAPLIVQQELYFDEEMPEMPCVYILSSGGPNVDGDRYEQHFVVRRNAYAHIATGAATKLAEMRCNFSGMVQSFELEEGAYLEYLPEPTIPCRHTRFACDTSIRIAPSATLFYAEIYTSGRRFYGGERFVYDLLSVCTHAERPDGRQLFREKFVVRPHALAPGSPGMMNGYDIFGNAVVLTPRDKADEIYARTRAFIDPEAGLAAGITRLPDDCGLSFRVLGADTEAVQRTVRGFCSTVRQAVKGKPLFGEFPWRQLSKQI